jgi:hypothetical protein
MCRPWSPARPSTSPTSPIRPASTPSAGSASSPRAVTGSRSSSARTTRPRPASIRASRSTGTTDSGRGESRSCHLSWGGGTCDACSRASGRTCFTRTTSRATAGRRACRASTRWSSPPGVRTCSSRRGGRRGHVPGPAPHCAARTWSPSIPSSSERWPWPWARGRIASRALSSAWTRPPSRPASRTRGGWRRSSSAGGGSSSLPAPRARTTGRTWWSRRWPRSRRTWWRSSPGGGRTRACSSRCRRARRPSGRPRGCGCCRRSGRT